MKKFFQINNAEALFEAYPELGEVKVRFDDLEGERGHYSPKKNEIVISNQLRGNDSAIKEVLIHEIQHAVQHIGGFATGASAEYWQGRINEDYAQEQKEARIKAADADYRKLFEAAPKELQDKVREVNRAKLAKDWDKVGELEDAIYESEYADEYSAISDADFERRLARDSEAGADPRELYERTAGEIEARDAAKRRDMSPEQRKNTRPDIDREDVVFADDVGYSAEFIAVHNKRITASMTDTERTAIIKGKRIEPVVYKGQADIKIRENLSDLESGKIGLVKSALIRIGEEFNVFTGYDVSDVDVKFVLSKSNLKESVSKDVSGVQLAKLLPVLKHTVENAVGIERHENRYFYDSDTLMFENLLGGYIDGKAFVPVRFGLKHSKMGKATLYVIVDQHPISLEKIKKAEVVNTPRAHDAQENVSRSATSFSISEIVRFVNGQDLLRYLPDDMLSSWQKSAKWEAIAKTIKTTNEKNDRKYFKYLSKGDVRNAEQMVIAAARANGYSVKVYHGTENTSGFTVFIGNVFTSNNRDVAWSYAGDEGKIYNLYLNPKDFLKVNGEGASNRQIKMPEEIKNYYATTARAYERWFQKGLASTDEIAEAAKALGYKGVWFENIGDSGMHLKWETDPDGFSFGKTAPNADVFVAFDSSQIKSADPVTYDDDGNVIPLSERFKAEDPDIRYSLKRESMSDLEVLETAAKGMELETLTPEQRKALDVFRKRFDRVRAMQEQRAELGRLYKEQMFTKGGKSGEKDKGLMDCCKIGDKNCGHPAERPGVRNICIIPSGLSAPQPGSSHRQRDI